MPFEEKSVIATTGAHVVAIGVTLDEVFQYPSD